MSLLDGSDVIKIKLYYKYIKTEVGRKLVIFEDEKAEELLKDETKKQEIEVLETRWSFLTWKDQNDIMRDSSKVINPATGERQFNFLDYRDSVIKRCLKGWNILENEKPVPVTPEMIDSLPGIIVGKLYDKYDKYIDYTETELEN